MLENERRVIQPDVSIFNGYIGAMVLFAMEAIGFFRLMREKGSVAPDDAKVLGVQEAFLVALCRVLQAIGVLSKNARDSYELTPQGKLITQQIGFFLWAVGGYGDLLRNLAPIATGQKQFGRDVSRDDSFVVKGSGRNLHAFVLPPLYSLLDSLPGQVLADVGCGNAELLIHACQRYPHLRAVGIERSARACEIARQNIVDAGLEKRIEIVEADARDPFRNASAQGVELLLTADMVTCLFMLHDLIEDEVQAISMLHDFRQVFGQAAHFIFADTMQTVTVSNLRQSFFILGFELTHAFMQQRLWEKGVYDKLFSSAGFETLRCLELEVPSTWMYLLRAI
jgi:SAM-dependent methyltransferase